MVAALHRCRDLVHSTPQGLDLHRQVVFAVGDALQLFVQIGPLAQQGAAVILGFSHPAAALIRRQAPARLVEQRLEGRRLLIEGGSGDGGQRLGMLLAEHLEGGFQGSQSGLGIAPVIGQLVAVRGQLDGGQVLGQGVGGGSGRQPRIKGGRPDTGDHLAMQFAVGEKAGVVADTLGNLDDGRGPPGRMDQQRSGSRQGPGAEDHGQEDGALSEDGLEDTPEQVGHGHVPRVRRCSRSRRESAHSSGNTGR